MIENAWRPNKIDAKECCWEAKITVLMVTTPQKGLADHICGGNHPTPMLPSVPSDRVLGSQKVAQKSGRPSCHYVISDSFMSCRSPSGSHGLIVRLMIIPREWFKQII